MGTFYSNNWSELYHYGVKGQKWGVRRYQNKDGTLTTAGKKRYRIEDEYKDYDEDRDWGKIKDEIFDKFGDTYDNRYGGENGKKAKKWKDEQKEKLEKMEYNLGNGVESIRKYREADKKYQDFEKMHANDKGLVSAVRNDFTRGKLLRERNNAHYNYLFNDKSPDMKAYRDAVYQAGKKFREEKDSRFASAILRDLGYEDTKKGREFLIKNNLIWMD